MPLIGPRYSGHNAFGNLMSREYGSQASPREFALRMSGPSSGLVMKTQLQRNLEEHRGCVNTVSFTPDGDRLISGSDDQKIIIWDWSRGELTSPRVPSTRTRIPTHVLELTASNVDS
jgi:DDB1- and CUL4-associated factor 8